MLFNSLQFIVFFIIVTILFFELSHKNRWKLLLIASCYFYIVFKPVYILILGFTIVVDYFAGIQIEKSSGRRRKQFLVASLIANIGVLVIFKYWNFMAENLNQMLSVFSVKEPIPLLQILLPIGLSFHTFQAMSYTIEVYRGNQKAERHFGIYSLYVMFYPQLVAGPIERPQNLLHQFHEEHFWDFERFKEGFTQMLWGFFKKVVIADRLAILVNEMYGDIHHQTGSNLAFAACFFLFQIYCDFSGYSDIAIGSAKVMGFHLMTNFNVPFSSRNITEFWRKWHISLSTWFNDYLFTPLSLSFRNLGLWGISAALFITFFISGLWHGAAWKFIIYGVLHGVALIYEIHTKKIRKKWNKNIPHWIYNPLSILITTAYVAFSWIFFRANTIADAFEIIRRIFSTSFFQGIHSMKLNTTELIFCMALIILLSVKDRFIPKVESISTPKFFGVSALMLILIYFFGVFNANSFIYFQF